MSDDQKPPPFPRARSSADRDVRRVHTPARGVEAVDPPLFVEDECTGQYEGEELERMRARRPTPMRLAHLEHKHDEMSKTLIVVKTNQEAFGRDLEEIKGDVKEVVKSNERVASAFETFMKLDQQHAHGESVVSLVKETTTATLATHVLTEQAEQKKFTRGMWLAVVGGLVSSGAVGALIHWLANR